VPLPDNLAEPYEIEITLGGPLSEGLELYPFSLGPRSVLETPYALRALATAGIARFAFGLMTFLSLALFVVWLNRRSETAYLCLSAACAAALPILAHFAYGAIPALVGYWAATIAWRLGVGVYVLLILMFLRRFLGLDLQWQERLLAALLFVVWIIVTVSPVDLIVVLTLWANVIVTFPFSLLVLVLLWRNRARLSPLDMTILFGCLSLSSALGVYELLMRIPPIPARDMHTFQWMPMAMSLACIWIILSQLFHTLGEYETLTASLQKMIAQKTAELEASFAKISEITAREAVEAERRRVMLDLHDGVGGQLVSTLAYMQRNETGDENIKRALEDALRDLALMLDSMGSHDSFPTLLGMLRSRLEDLLSDHGITFDWQIHGDPTPAQAGPSEALNLTRIVQEAITNVIKHAAADRIAIHVDDRTIRIADNGRGFDVEARTGAGETSHGLENMRRRSAALGAAFQLDSNSAGTTITLRLR
jgi:signal transduction histidine kinase